MNGFESIKDEAKQAELKSGKITFRKEKLKIKMQPVNTRKSVGFKEKVENQICPTVKNANCCIKNCAIGRINNHSAKYPFAKSAKSDSVLALFNSHLDENYFFELESF